MINKKIILLLMLCEIYHFVCHYLVLSGNLITSSNLYKKQFYFLFDFVIATTSYYILRKHTKFFIINFLVHLFVVIYLFNIMYIPYITPYYKDVFEMAEQNYENKSKFVIFFVYPSFNISLATAKTVTIYCSANSFSLPPSNANFKSS